MITHHNNTAHRWFDGVNATEWLARVRENIQTALKTFDTGLKAAHDYERLTAHVSPQQAIEIVFQRHFRDL